MIGVASGRRALLVLGCSAALALGSARAALPADGGALDPSFSTNGKVTTTFPGGAYARGVAIGSDGSIVVVGGAEGGFAIARFDPAGVLDPTFGGNGKVTTSFTGDDEARAVAIQADGKTVVAGRAGDRFGLARYDDAGVLDPTFGGDGTVVTNFTQGRDIAYAIAIQADGKIVAAGASNPGDGSAFALARYDDEGVLDPTFGGDGKVTTQFGHFTGTARALAIQANGRIVAAGESLAGGGFALVRYRADGTRDPRFSGDGKKVTTFYGDYGGGALGVLVQPDGRIVAAGTALEIFGPFGLARYTPQGRLDATFGHDGRVTTHIDSGEESASGVVIQANGKLVAAGYTGLPHEVGDPDEGAFVLTRYRTNGVLDPSFGGDGIVQTRFQAGLSLGTAVAIQADGAIVVAGWAGSRFGLARYLP
jgi:uncharacterized delta-60 repeat protein